MKKGKADKKKTSSRTMFIRIVAGACALLIFGLSLLAALTM